MRWKCLLCGSIQESDPNARHTMDYCSCKKTAVDDEGCYCRFKNRDNIEILENEPEPDPDKEILDELFRGNITFTEAADKLGVGKEDIHLLADAYDYVPTTKDEYEILKRLEMIE